MRQSRLASVLLPCRAFASGTPSPPHSHTTNRRGRLDRAGHGRVRPFSRGQCRPASFARSIACPLPGWHSSASVVVANGGRRNPSTQGGRFTATGAHKVLHYEMVSPYLPCKSARFAAGSGSHTLGTAVSPHRGTPAQRNEPLQQHREEELLRQMLALIRSQQGTSGR